MGMSIFFVASAFIAAIYIPGVTSGQLYLQPDKSQHGYFTDDSFFVTCLTADNTLDQLKWVVNDNHITAKTGRVHVQPAPGGQQGLELVVEKVEMEDAGTYMCTDVHNSMSFELSVYKSISFGNTPKVQHSEEYKNAHVECHARRESMMQVGWYFKGSKLATNSKYMVEGSKLTIINASRFDAGEYMCEAIIAEAFTSQIKSIAIDFQVYYKPERVERGSDTVYSAPSSKAVLNCEADANPAPKFEWFKNEDMLKNDSDYTIISNESVSSLHVITRNEDKFGMYICRASNEKGWFESQVTLKTGAVPATPTIKIVKEEPAVLTLDMKTDDILEEGLGVTGFKVQYKLTSEEWKDAEIADFHIGHQFQLKNISYNSVYVMRAAAINAAGQSEYSDPIQVTTKGLQVAQVTSGASRLYVPQYALILIGLFNVYLFWIARK